MNLNDENLMEAINLAVIILTEYEKNICDFRKGDFEDLDKIVKIVLRSKKFLRRQSSNEKLYAKRENSRWLKSFKEVYDNTGVQVAC